MSKPRGTDRLSWPLCYGPLDPACT